MMIHIPSLARSDTFNVFRVLSLWIVHVLFVISDDSNDSSRVFLFRVHNYIYLLISHNKQLCVYNCNEVSQASEQLLVSGLTTI